MNYPLATLSKNDKKANIIIWTISIIVFVAVVVLHEIKIDIDLGFNPHIFAEFNALINGTVAILLILGLIFIKIKKYMMHKRIMNLSIILSVLFLLSYIAHHIFAGNAIFGDIDHSGDLSEFELGKVADKIILYRVILISHILLAGLSLPFILYTAYRASIAEFGAHKKLAKYVYPVWLYVAITGVVVFIMISPYYETSL